MRPNAAQLQSNVCNVKVNTAAAAALNRDKKFVFLSERTDRRAGPLITSDPSLTLSVCPHRVTCRSDRYRVIDRSLKGF